MTMYSCRLSFREAILLQNAIDLRVLAELGGLEPTLEDV